MVQRVNHGPCRQCGAPVLYEGAEYCSPRCNGIGQQRHCALCRETIAIDSERQVCEKCFVRDCKRCGQRLARDNFLDTCMACQDVEREALEQRRCDLCGEAVTTGVAVCERCAAKVARPTRDVLVLDNETELIRDDLPLPPIVCVGFADARDYWVFHRDEARVPVEAALRSDRLIVGHYVAYDMATICTQWPALIPLVLDAYEADRVTDTMLREKLIDIARGAYFDGIEYPLEGLARKRCGLQLDKTWQTRFQEVRHLPVSEWPVEAFNYVVGDVVSPFAIYREQEGERHWLADQYRQARAAFVFELVSAWGLHTDPDAVRVYREQLETKFAQIAEEMIAHGLMRRKSTRKKATGLIETELVRTMKAVKARVEQAYVKNGKKLPRTDASPKFPEGQTCTDADTCERSGDEVLAHYADLSSTSTMLSNFVPMLERGTRTPLHVKFTSLLVTGRTSSSPNVQNLPTDPGVRECFVPRPGFVYIVSDYAGIELRTWAQVCYTLFGQSKLREALNEGVDPHTKMASLILGISYEQAVSEYAQDRKGRVYLPRQAGKAGNFGFPGGAGYESWREYARTAYRVDVPKDDPSAPIDAKRVKAFWREAWDEAELYHDWIAQQCEAGNGYALIEQAYVGRFRGCCRFTEASNTLFQGLAADLAKRALWLVMKACYAQPNSPLYGSRMVNFVHDEVVTETPDNDRAHEAAHEQERLMIVAAKEFLPDITNVECETLLARRWSKAAKPVRDEAGRLVPWDIAA